MLGTPIAHSLSPVLHAAAYRVLGLDWAYDAHEVDEAGLAGFLDRLGGPELEGEWAGLSLTMPLKRVALGLCDSVSETAAQVSAVNTVTFPGGAGRRGDNTDVPGLVNALAEAGVVAVPRAAVLGGGATAASALAALRLVCRGPVDVVVRSPARAAEMTDLAARLGMDATIRPWDDADAALAAPLVLATTPKGAVDALAGAVPAAPGVLFDVVYDPWPTPLAAAWAAVGGAVLGGLDLLVHQAVLQVRLMTGAELPTGSARAASLVAAMRAAGAEALAAQAAAPRS